MKWLLRIVLALVVLAALAAAAIYFTGNTFYVIARLGQPRHGWDMSYKAPAPDYVDARNWAALPGAAGLTALTPPGEKPAKVAAVDVFFIHPTGYISGGDWNSPMDPNTRTEENTKWMMANQASVFNGCCAIYAPRYRETSIYRYFNAPEDVAAKARDLAYGDVVRAFDYFLQHYSNGRPFIVASHSQGTEHGFRLLKERIDGTPLASRLVAAYLIGFQITDKDAAALKTVHVCASATDTGCFVHWATWGEGGKPQYRSSDKLVCVNPLSWQRDGSTASKAINLGAEPLTGTFALNFLGSDNPQGTVFGPLEAPLPHWTWAACRAGLLTVADQSGGPFARMDMGGKNYHGLDYALFATNIRANAKARVEAYLKDQLTDGTAPPK
ncbi:MAG: DUF3089 domain-containing protein [Alphaproteobacteria bacterium]|nr:DUF3089 domain-containing protein [Alphaproteobacteria bacterium]MBV9693514.1 DUF3089 domain-containing protein [Alphaproteobacteria bacterium]